MQLKHCSTQFDVRGFQMPPKSTGMTRPGKNSDSSDRSPPGTQGKSVAQVVVLAVGDSDQWSNANPNLPWDTRIAFANFSEINRDLIGELKPNIVLAPLLCRTFDCIDLAQVLCRSGFQGLFRVFTFGLPDPAIVVDEARALCPDLDIEMVTEEPAPRHRAN